MRISWRFAAAAIVFVSLVGTAPTSDDQDETAKVEAIIARSKITRATYAIYFWNRIQRPGEEAVEEWSAEFHSGNLHRVETPRDRIVADCAARTGTYLSLVTGESITGARVAGVACGINTNREFVAVETLGRVRTHSAEADRVRITDSENVRTYDVSDDGILLRTVFETNDARRLVVLNVDAVEVSRNIPDRGMFEEASLKRSFVPENFKVAPEAIRRFKPR